VGLIQSRSIASSSISFAERKKTCLHEIHLSHGGKMCDFAGYAMPTQYAGEGITESHKHTRSHCGLFDVSHMLQSHVYGRDRVQFVESLTVADVEGLQPNTGTLSLFTTEEGGISDDLIITKTDGDYIYLVTNAGCRDKDIALMRDREREMKSQGKDVTVELLDERGLIAIQGPESSTALAAIAPKLGLDKMRFMTTAVTDVAGVENCRVTRCGYTGEDGFEISIPQTAAVAIVSELLSLNAASVRLAGLGARDSLRLEAGLCLYGNDIDETTTPVEAGLAWTIGKRRKVAKDFPGADIILKQVKEKPGRRRVGLVSHSGPPARNGTEITSANGGEKVGEVTSGCPSPTLGLNIAMGYVESSLAKPGTKVKLLVRRREVEAEVVKMPFVPAKYFM